MGGADRPIHRRRRRTTRRDPALIEQYKVFVQSADNTSGRRVSVNRYQTSLNIAVVALYGLAPSIAPQPALPVIVAMAGVIISLNWLFTIRSMRRLNVEKFRIIHSMEEKLPRAVYFEEWEGLGRVGDGDGKKWWKDWEWWKGWGKWRYRGANTFENQIPQVFTVLHFIAAGYAIFRWTS